MRDLLCCGAMSDGLVVRNSYRVACSLGVMRGMGDGEVDLVLADPPYSEFPLINDSIREARRVCRGACLYFMYAEDLCLLDEQPDQVLFWVKPVSTKNTSRRYSRFVEVIAAYGVDRINQGLHWSNRTGVFTDHLVRKQVHPFEKPASLIERLVLNHSSPGDTVLDPFAGVGTVHRCCVGNGRGSISVEIDGQWAEHINPGHVVG